MARQNNLTVSDHEGFKYDSEDSRHIKRNLEEDSSPHQRNLGTLSNTHEPLKDTTACKNAREGVRLLENSEL